MKQLVQFLKTLQLIATYDKAAVIAGLLSILTLLAARFGLKLNASDTAYLASALTALVGAFTHYHFNAPKARLTLRYQEASKGSPSIAFGIGEHGEHEKP